MSYYKTKNRVTLVDFCHKTLCDFVVKSSIIIKNMFNSKNIVCYKDPIAVNLLKNIIRFRLVPPDFLTSEVVEVFYIILSFKALTQEKF